MAVTAGESEKANVTKLGSEAGMCQNPERSLCPLKHTMRVEGLSDGHEALLPFVWTD